MKLTLTALLSAAAMAATSVKAGTATVAGSINAFGLDLHRRLAAKAGNLVTSPWSIQSALAITWAGAAGKTKEEMAKVLHFTGEDQAVHEGFAGLAADLQKLAEQSRKMVDKGKEHGGPATPLEINVANRLFGQAGYPFEAPFLKLTEKTYAAPLEQMDFAKKPGEQRLKINAWVEQQTKERIKDLIPPGIIDPDTRLVLTNAVYLKAAWAEAFSEEKDAPFHVNGDGKPVKVPGLVRTDDFGYARIPGGAAVTIPYAGGGLQFVLFVPDTKDGLAAMEQKLTPETLTAAAQAPSRKIWLHFPQFKLEPDRVMLAENLTAMGMPTAFDKPEGSADFSGIAPRQPNDYLYISQVIHKAFIAVDKNGTEAAAATAVVMPRALSAPPQPERPLEVRVDRPFAFAIQHTGSGACLFLGRVSDPR